MAFGLQTAALNAVVGALGMRFDVSPAWKFYVEVLGVIIAEFNECSGLSMEREVKRVREGGTNDFEWLLPGQITYGNVTLKRGITYNRELWRWFRWGMLDGQVWGFHTIPGSKAAVKALKFTGIIVPQGTAMSIILGTVDGKKARYWNIIGAIPVKWTGPQMQSGSDQVAVEELEIAHQGIDLSLEMGTPMSFFSSDDERDLSSKAPSNAMPDNNYYDLYNRPGTAPVPVVVEEPVVEEEAEEEEEEKILHEYFEIDRDTTGFTDPDKALAARAEQDYSGKDDAQLVAAEAEDLSSDADAEYKDEYRGLDRDYSGGSKETAEAEDSAYWEMMKAQEEAKKEAGEEGGEEGGGEEGGTEGGTEGGAEGTG